MCTPWPRVSCRPGDAVGPLPRSSTRPSKTWTSDPPFSSTMTPNSVPRSITSVFGVPIEKRLDFSGRTNPQPALPAERPIDREQFEVGGTFQNDDRASIELQLDQP